MFEDKFNMSRKSNVFWAKRNIVDYIWKSARLENISVTYPQTECIYNGINVQSLNIYEVTAINNLKHGWLLVLSNLHYETDYSLLCQTHKAVGSNLILGAGFPRGLPVSIGGGGHLGNLTSLLNQ